MAAQLLHTREVAGSKPAAPIGLDQVRTISPTTIGFDEPAFLNQDVTTQYQSLGVSFGFAEYFSLPSPGTYDCGLPSVRALSYSISPPQVARLANCNTNMGGAYYSGTFGGFSSPRRSVSAYVHMSTTCDGPCFAPVKLVAYDASGAVVATGAANVPLEGWAQISASLPAGAAPAISSFALYREGSWEGSLAIDDLSFDNP